MIWSVDFWKGAGERAIKTWFQVFVSVAVLQVGGDAVGVTAGLTDIAWLSAVSVATFSAVLSLATSIGNANFTSGTGSTYIPEHKKTVISE